MASALAAPFVAHHDHGSEAWEGVGEEGKVGAEVEVEVEDGFGGRRSSVAANDVRRAYHVSDRSYKGWVKGRG